MDNYSKVLEFFMENGIQLNTDQMNELKMVCEKSNFNKYIDNKIANSKKYKDKSHVLQKVAMTSGGAAKDKALDLADKYEKESKAAMNTGLETHRERLIDGHRKSDLTAEDVKNDIDTSKKGKFYRGEDVAKARDLYRDLAAEKKRGGVDTENRKPGTFLSK